MGWKVFCRAPFEPPEPIEAPSREAACRTILPAGSRLWFDKNRQEGTPKLPFSVSGCSEICATPYRELSAEELRDYGIVYEAQLDLLADPQAKDWEEKYNQIDPAILRDHIPPMAGQE